MGLGDLPRSHSQTGAAVPSQRGPQAADPGGHLEPPATT